jgi:hypothetical protein
VVVDEGEGQGNVERSVLEGARRTLARLECTHQVNPTGRTFHLEGIDEFGTEYGDKQLLELKIDACDKKILKTGSIEANTYL